MKPDKTAMQIELHSSLPDSCATQTTPSISNRSRRMSSSRLKAGLPSLGTFSSCLLCLSCLLCAHASAFTNPSATSGNRVFPSFVASFATIAGAQASLSTLEGDAVEFNRSESLIENYSQEVWHDSITNSV